MRSSLASGADLIYVSLSNHTIETYDVSLSSAAAIQSSRSVFANTDLNDPYGLAFDNAGNLFAANYYDGTIAKFTSNGLGSIFASGPTGPVGLAFDAGGNLYAANHDRNIVTKFDATGTNTTFATGFNIPVGLAFDVLGNLYVSSFYGPTITKVAPNGSGSNFGNGYLSLPRGLAFDNDGKLHAANGNAGIYAMTISRFTQDGSGSTFASTGLNGAYGITFDRLGNFYVANSVAGTIAKFNSQGVLQFSWSTVVEPRFLAFRPSIVPEPSTYALGLIGTVVLALLARRKSVRRHACI